MITSRLPRPGHAWRAISLPFAALLVWDVAVTIAYRADPRAFPKIEIQFTLFGTAIALFVGFMVNAAYQRWWEARILWGGLVNASRTLARQALLLIDDRDSAPTDHLAASWSERSVSGSIVRAQIAYVHVVRTGLRGQPLPPEAETYLPSDVRAEVAAATNPRTALLTYIGRLLREATRRDLVSDYLRGQLESTLAVVTDVQGGLERIKNTPLPVQYRFFPRLFTRIFGAILPFAVVSDLGWATPVGSGLVCLMFLLAVQIGDDLAEPFADQVYDVPMTALARTIEIDLTEMLGDPAPTALQPVDQVLW